MNATVIRRDYLVGLKNRPWSVIFLQIQDFFKHFTSLIKILEHCCMKTALEFGSSSGWWSRITFPISVHMNASRGLKTVKKTGRQNVEEVAGKCYYIPSLSLRVNVRGGLKLRKFSTFFRERNNSSCEPGKWTRGRNFGVPSGNCVHDYCC